MNAVMVRIFGFTTAAFLAGDCLGGAVFCCALAPPASVKTEMDSSKQFLRQEKGRRMRNLLWRRKNVRAHSLQDSAIGRMGCFYRRGCRERPFAEKAWRVTTSN